MQLIETVGEMIVQRDQWRQAGRQIGLVPTMGYLHEGHLSLVRQALAQNDVVVLSIFVNPLQFGPKDDFSRYPRDLNRDLALVAEAGVTAVYHPGVETMYPAGFDARVEVGGITGVLEGLARPGHFAGVTTVVTKLLHAVGPSRVYFGQKDAQQVAVIRKMVRDLDFGLEVVVCPTYREADGLAMSSRNVYLSKKERAAAPVLFRALSQAAQQLQAAPQTQIGQELRTLMQEIISQEELAHIDYVSVTDAATLQEYSGPIPAGANVLLSLAVRFGATRLIDNILIGP